MINKKLLLAYGKEVGFHAVRFISSQNLSDIFTEYEGVNWFYVSSVKDQLNHYFGQDLFAPGVTFSFLMCGLSYYKREDCGSPGDKTPYGLLAPFARRNYYAEAVYRLKKVAFQIRKKTGPEKKVMRIFCNSGAPEKFLAWASGLGMYGKNSLIINTSLGSSFIIAGLLLLTSFSGPGELEMPESPGTLCGDCHRCMMSCPTQAIKIPGIIDQSRCIQALSTALTIFPETIKRAFKNRIYGCQVCQDVCPYNRGLSLETGTERGVLGPRFSLITLLQKSPVELKEVLKKTVPGSSCIDMRALLRNGLLAAGNLGDPSLIPLITPFCRSKHPAVVDAARWALDVIPHAS